MATYEEIFEQTETLQVLLETQWDGVKKIAEVIKSKEIKYVFLAARGSSDNACRYAKYLLGAHNSLPVAMAAPSLFSIYKRAPKLQDSLVIGISQSGQSPDIVSVIGEAKKQNVPTVAFVNDINSPLALASDYIVNLCAGSEKGVAATKTYTAQLLAIAMLSAALSENDQNRDLIFKIPKYVQNTFRLEGEIANLVQKFMNISQCVVLGRGYNYSTAFEWSLKIKELAYIFADPYSPADFMHGPIALIDESIPIFVIAPDGDTYSGNSSLIRKFENEYKVKTVVLSNRKTVTENCSFSLILPDLVPEWISPLTNMVPVQLFVYHLALAKGMDVDHPRGLSKVTKTK
ncbi:SIS domain-containing protein [bacterium]|nr:SIS domain-containing protein [bacterium]